MNVESLKPRWPFSFRKKESVTPDLEFLRKAAYWDSLDCPQQKCLMHLLRDLNDDVLDHPYDEELKELVKSFGDRKSVV